MNKMIRFIPLVLFVVLGVVLYRGLSLDPKAMPSALVDNKMPSFQLPALGDKNRLLTEKDLTGDIVLLNVWGTWCVYCKYEHPYLLDIAKSKRVTVYGLNYKDIRKDAQQWLTQYEDPYVFSIFDELGKLGIELGVTAAPETFVIDHNGIIRMKHVGPIDGGVWQQKFLPLISKIEDEKRAAQFQRGS